MNDDDDELTPDEEDYFENFDCHMDNRGDCGMAGSEDCEFECPIRRLARIERLKP